MLVEHLGESMPERGHTKIRQNTEELDENMQFETADSILLNLDLIEILGYGTGFCIFMLVLFLILYLKCRQKTSPSPSFHFMTTKGKMCCLLSERDTSSSRRKRRTIPIHSPSLQRVICGITAVALHPLKNGQH